MEEIYEERQKLVDMWDALPGYQRAMLMPKVQPFFAAIENVIKAMEKKQNGD